MWRCLGFFLVTLLIATGFSGCVNNFARFYEPAADLNQVPQRKYIPLMPNEKPNLVQASNIQEAVKKARRQGFILIGYASFNGEKSPEWALRNQAEKVGATHVLYTVEHTSTEKETATLVMPDVDTTYHSGSTNSYSSGTNYGLSGGGYGSYSSTSSGTYSGTSTTYGTDYVPITTTTRRYDQTAVFFVRATNDMMRLGAHYGKLPSELRRELGRNQGTVIQNVVDGSPAFYGNLIPGDVVLSVNDYDVKGPKSFSEILELQKEDSTISMEVWRNGERESLSIDLSENDLPDPLPEERIKELRKAESERGDSIHP